MSEPRSIGRYAVRGLLGTGGFATVWLAYDDRLEDHVAIKVLAENWSERLDIRERFEREARLFRRTKSSHVVDVHDIDELPDGRPYFVMTHADQGNLADLLEDGPLAVGRVLRFGADIARGAVDLHRAGVVHRDIKPSNVLFRSANTPGDVDLLLADLGLSREIARGSRLTLTAGTPGYIAPEQDDPDRVIDERVDIYGVGATVYHALTGRPPTVPLAVPSALRPGLPAGADAVVLRALARDPDERWDSAEALAAALEDLAAAATTGPSPAAPPVPRSRPRGVPLAALVVVLLVGVVAVVEFGIPFASRKVHTDPAPTSAPTSASETGGSAVPLPATSGSKPAPSTQVAPPPVSADTRDTVTVTAATSPAKLPEQPIPTTPNCQHAQGDGVAVSAAYLLTTTSPPEKVGAIQLCRDATHYGAYLVRYKPLPPGQWANARLDRYADGNLNAPFSCAATTRGANGVMTGGGHECWTPKVPGTAANLTFQAIASQCDGVYDNHTHCTASGNTARMR